MSLFLPCFLSSFYQFFLSFFLSVLDTLSFLQLSWRGSPHPPLPPRFHLWLPLKVSQTIFGLLWAFFQDCPLTHCLAVHYHYLVRICCITSCFMTKFLFVWFHCETSNSQFQTNKNLGFSSLTSMACIKWS